MVKNINTEAESKMVWAKPFYRPIEYAMPKEMAKILLSERKGADRNMTQQAYLCKIVNEDFNLLGYCTKVTTI